MPAPTSSSCQKEGTRLAHSLNPLNPKLEFHAGQSRIEAYSYQEFFSQPRDSTTQRQQRLDINYVYLG